MKAAPMDLEVRSPGGLILHQETVEVGKYLELKIDKGERFFVDGCPAFKGPGLIRLENRGESGFHLHVDKGGIR